ncbi:MAG TPA: hypothetical protein VD838_09830 [Anaeromyxobacteraceae bacterium]|nr:hypothetical protein [Anaeromyxobacteraceae bacterium]
MIHEAGDRMGNLSERLAAIGVQPTAENLALMQAMIIVQAQSLRMSRETFVAWVSRMFDSIAADLKKAQARGGR